ncbi:TetR/AcrR family transcriptional regulator [Streptomonospora salina]|uniref:AcrR family transcriptional regulator n=1 Tax=Streptomonospora salina TaxID=104205 RepID=A0A841ECM9_9ACTN|nr:TetR/AcrR family transcriptional regulator [Streptomonospora salina]MBB5997191.1 AcrR family transcriptional regulator [Streptomonospora salina]
MPQPDRTAAAPHAPGAERDARAERILDATGELLVSRGYRRVTVDDVAKRADVGKGTVYLHFHTKELLFLTVLMRAQAAMLERLIQGFRADPERIRPSAVARTHYLMVADDPVARAMLVGDSETLGSLITSGVRELGAFMRVRITVMTEYFHTLHEHGLLQPGTPPDRHMSAYFRILFGYIAAEPATDSMLTGTGTEGDAAMIAHIVRASLEASEPGPAAVRAAAPQVVGQFEHLLTRLHEEIAEQKRT